jgi:hypothetical protein
VWTHTLHTCYSLSLKCKGINLGLSQKVPFWQVLIVAWALWITLVSGESPLAWCSWGRENVCGELSGQGVSICMFRALVAHTPFPEEEKEKILVLSPLAKDDIPRDERHNHIIDVSADSCGMKCTANLRIRISTILRDEGSHLRCG